MALLTIAATHNCGPVAHWAPRGHTRARRLVLPQGWWWRRGVKWTVSMGDGYDLKGWEYGRALEGPFDAIRRTIPRGLRVVR